MSVAPDPPELAAARRLAPDVSAAADEAERDRRAPRRLIDAMADAGLFAIAVPKSVGGRERDAATLLRVCEEMARADGSIGWCLMIGATTGTLYGALPESAGRAVYGENPRAVTCGVFHPRGEAHVVSGGYRVRGRWSFASACENADWLCCGAIVFENGTPRTGAGGPDICTVLFPAREARVIDTWTVSGLRGTGSHDLELDDVFVPTERSVLRGAGTGPRERGPLYTFPMMGLLALGVASSALGIGRRALDEIAALAAEKTPTGGRRRLADRGVVQADLARAEATLRAARAYFYEAVAEAWDLAARSGAMTLAVRANLRLAATHATASAVRAVDVAYTTGGGSANYATSPLQRCFRDVHAITQHVAVAPPTWEFAGRFLLGLDADASML